MDMFHACLLRFDLTMPALYPHSRNFATAAECFFRRRRPSVAAEPQFSQRLGKLSLGTNIRLALYQPDIAGNTGTILRMAACLGLAVDIIEPAGFDLSDRNLRRAGMDYLEMAALRRHIDFAHFDEWRHNEERRLVLFSTKADLPYTHFSFADGDILLFGREFGRCSRRRAQSGRCASHHSHAGWRPKPECRAQRRHGRRRGPQAARLARRVQPKHAFTPCWRAPPRKLQTGCCQ